MTSRSVAERLDTESDYFSGALQAPSTIRAMRTIEKSCGTLDTCCVPDAHVAVVGIRMHTGMRGRTIRFQNKTSSSDGSVADFCTGQDESYFSLICLDFFFVFNILFGHSRV